jgi:hypothetical protein
MAKNATKKQKRESVSDTVTTPSGQVLMLTVAMEPVQRVTRDRFPTLQECLAQAREAEHA